jgi:hypothetical protein
VPLFGAASILSIERPGGSRGADAVGDGTGKKSDEPDDELQSDRLKISANASLAYEDAWRNQGVVEEARQSLGCVTVS